MSVTPATLGSSIALASHVVAWPTIPALTRRLLISRHPSGPGQIGLKKHWRFALS